MADFMVVNKEFLENGIKSVSDAVRSKTGKTDLIPFPDALKAEIEGIPESYWSEAEVADLVSEKTKVTRLKIPDGITKISHYIFYGMTSLIIESLPDTIESIEDSAFRDCYNLSLTKLPSQLKSIGDYAFRQATIYISELPEGLETIGSYAFLNRSGLTIKSIPASVKVLNVSCFQGCPNLTEITFKGTPDTIAANVFNACTNLAVINVPWAEGEVANARWGAPETTVINYNYIEEMGE